MVYDTFIFYNELEVLEIRLNSLDAYVDRFVLVEATKTFQGNSKPLYFEQNKHRYQRFLHKIIHVVVDDLPESDEPFDLEAYQRNAIMRGLTDSQPNDYVMISDVDEIPNPAKIPQTINDGQWHAFSQRLFYYRMNNLCENLQNLPWSTLTLRKDLTSPSEIRRALCAFHSAVLGGGVECGKFTVIRDGGWHFSYLGDPGFIANKIRAFSHKEFNTEEITDLARLADVIRNKVDLFGRDLTFRLVDTSGLPDYVQQNRAKYLALGLLDDY